STCVRIRPRAPVDIGISKSGSELISLGPDIEIGEYSFDSVARVRGHERDLAWVLSKDARDKIWDCLVLNASVKVEDGVLSYTKSGVPDTSSLSSLVELLLDTARSMYSGEPEKRLEENVRHDPCIPIRRRSLEALARDFPKGAALQAAAEVARHDIDPGIRVLGSSLSADGTEQLCEEALEVGNPYDARCAALEAIGRTDSAVSDSDRQRIFEQVLSEDVSGLRGLAKVVLRLAIRLGSRVPTEWLIAALQRAEEDTVRAAAAYIKAMRVPLADTLCDALGREVLSPETLVDLLTAMGQVGDVSLVQRLEPIAEGAWGTTAVRRAARTAIEEIQSRATGASEGQLALVHEAGSSAGALTLPNDQGGGMSLETSQSAAGSTSAEVDSLSEPEAPEPALAEDVEPAPR
ncbi:MAG: hypothetical protein KC561_15055, partial [Myxococcales bacterium]|nr:hypothetical protein [Myxococcales bacterium]